MSALRRAVVAQFARPRGLFGHLAGWIMARRGSNKARNRWAVDLVAPVAGEALAEIGCGPGLAVAPAARRAPGTSLTGFDHSAIMLAQAARRLARLAPDADWRLVEGGPERLGTGDFDAIWSVNVVQFFADRDAAFAAILEALKPGGRAITVYMPRGAASDLAAAQAMAEAVTASMRVAGFVSIEIHTLDLKPVPVIAVIGRKVA